VSDEDMKVQLARQDERLKVIEKQIAGIDRRIWGAVVMILAYVANQFLKLITLGGG